MPAPFRFSPRLSRRLALATLLPLAAVLALFLYVNAELPQIRSIGDYVPKQSSRVYSDDGLAVGAFFTERRSVVPFGNIPKHVVQAFLAAEDANFYAHEGIDYFGIMRAFFKNLRPGAHLQGASTITQQTVKTLVLGPERSYTRKIREALLARHLEQLLHKDEILAIYLNQIYFGSGAYGVEEAARTYFGKSVTELGLGEGALLAAIPKNPSRYNVRHDPDSAKVRQHYVLSQMQQRGWADAAAVAAAIAAPVPMPPEADSPAYASYLEIVRRTLLEQVGETQLYEGGLTIYVGMAAHAQRAAAAAVQQGLEDLSRRQGYAGAPVRIEVDRLVPVLKGLHAQLATALTRRGRYAQELGPAARWIWDLQGLGHDALLAAAAGTGPSPELRPLETFSRVQAPVVRLDRVRHEAWVDLGTAQGRLPLAGMAWARRFAPRNLTPMPRDPGDVLRVGDIVTVEVTARGIGPRTLDPVTLQLVPEVRAQAALVAIDPHSRLVRSLVGGYNVDAAGFNRATQALRQPGSAFKPLLYAAAIAAGILTPATLCPDSPVVIPDPWTGKLWKPENYEDGRYDGNITYRQALMRSKNTCSVRLMQKLTPEKAIETARALGIASKLPNNLTLALGTGEVTPLELTNAYASIAAGGLFAEPVFVRKVVDRSGTILFESKSETRAAISPQAAYVVTSMMRSVVDQGTAARALILDRPLAGKTGTSQDSRDVWFGGFSPELVATVWMGFDNNDPLGRVTGSSAALPAWIRYMGAALPAGPPRDFVMPEGIVQVRTNVNTGVPEEGPNSIDEVFVAGTEPTAATQNLPSVFLEDGN